MLHKQCGLGIHRIELDGDFIEFRSGPAGTVELLNLHVNTHRRRNGKGTDLLNRMIEAIGPNHLIYLFTRAENNDAHGFYEANGFNKVSEVIGFYNLTPKDEIGLSDILWSGDAYFFMRRV